LECKQAAGASGASRINDDRMRCAANSGVALYAGGDVRGGSSWRPGAGDDYCGGQNLPRVFKHTLLGIRTALPA